MVNGDVAPAMWDPIVIVLCAETCYTRNSVPGEFKSFILVGDIKNALMCGDPGTGSRHEMNVEYLRFLEGEGIKADRSRATPERVFVK